MMCNAWNHPADCTCGWGGEGHAGRVASAGPPSLWQLGFFYATGAPAWQHRESFAAPATCPKCESSVYFIRHNGGSVWVDELGWPWSKHSCFNTVADPRWLTYLGKGIAAGSQATKRERGGATTEPGRATIGIVTLSVRHQFPARSAIALFLDCGENAGRWAVIVEGTNTADYFLGCLGVISPDRRTVKLSNFETKALLVPPHLSENETELSGIRTALLKAALALQSAHGSVIKQTD